MPCAILIEPFPVGAGICGGCGVEVGVGRVEKSVHFGGLSK